MNEIVQKLFKINGRHYNDYMPVGLKIYKKLWWYFVPGPNRRLFDFIESKDETDQS